MDVLEKRFSQTDTNTIVRNNVTWFMLRETSDEFLIWLKSKNKEYLESLVMPFFYQLNSIPTYEFACRLEDLGLLEDECKVRLVNKIKEIAIENCDITFFNKNNHVHRILGETGKKEIIDTLIQLGPDHFRDEFDALMENMEGDEEPNEYFSDWFSSIDILVGELKTIKLVTTNIEEEFNDLLDDVSRELNDYSISMQDYEEDYLEDYDETYSSYEKESYIVENNLLMLMNRYRFIMYICGELA